MTTAQRTSEITEHIVRMMLTDGKHRDFARGIYVGAVDYDGTDVPVSLIEFIVRSCEVNLAKQNGQPAFKAGDHVRVVGNTLIKHFFSLGQICTVARGSSNDTPWWDEILYADVRCDDGGQDIADVDLELVYRPDES